MVKNEIKIIPSYKNLTKITLTIILLANIISTGSKFVYNEKTNAVLVIS